SYHWTEADIAEVKNAAANGTTGVGKLALCPQVVAVDDGNNVTHQPGFIPDIQVVLVGEEVGTHALMLSGDRGNAAGPDKDDVLSDVRHVLSLPGAKTLAHPHQQQQ